jgi:O-antigen ligase
LQSVSLVATAILFLLSEKPETKIKEVFKNLISVTLVGILLIYLLSFFNSENHGEYLKVIKNKIPYLFIPISLVSVQKLSKQQLIFIQYFFIVCCLYSSGWSYYQYLQNSEIYADLYARGEVIPTLIHHVSFAVLLCFAAIFVLNNSIHKNGKTEKIINVFLFIWFIYFLHILSVRTGILLLYVSLFLYGVILLITQKKIVITISLFLLLILSSIISYQKIPTIKSKIAYTFYGIAQYKNKQDTANVVSDARRILSDKIGIEILQKNKMSGVGLGDIKDEMNSIYKQQYPQFNSEVYSHIHNQYLYTICGVGLLTGSLFCILLLLPLFQFIRDKNYVFTLIYGMLLMVMLWEPFIESQIGNSIFLVVCCVGFLSKKVR